MQDSCELAETRIEIGRILAQMSNPHSQEQINKSIENLNQIEVKEEKELPITIKINTAAKHHAMYKQLKFPSINSVNSIKPDQILESPNFWEGYSWTVTHDKARSKIILVFTYQNDNVFKLGHSLWQAFHRKKDSIQFNYVTLECFKSSNKLRLTFSADQNGEFKDGYSEFIKRMNLHHSMIESDEGVKERELGNLSKVLKSTYENGALIQKPFSFRSIKYPNKEVVFNIKESDTIALADFSEDYSFDLNCNKIGTKLTLTISHKNVQSYLNCTTLWDELSKNPKLKKSITIESYKNSNPLLTKIVIKESNLNLIKELYADFINTLELSESTLKTFLNNSWGPGKNSESDEKRKLHQCSDDNNKKQRSEPGFPFFKKIELNPIDSFSTNLTLEKTMSDVSKAEKEFKI